ncbi:hypothetical protein V1519DRAFT_482932 [Lipomyces tetrasporus]
MEQFELLHTVRRPLSPNTQIEIPTSRSEFEHVLQILEEEGAKFPRLQKIADEVKMMPGPDASTKRHLSSTRGMNWDGALLYLTREETVPNHTLMIAVEVGLRYSFSVCALRCRVGIAMRSNEVGPCKRASTKYYATLEEKRIAIQNIEHVLRVQLLANPFAENRGRDLTYRLEDETSPPESARYSPHPYAAFTIVDDGRFVGGEVPANLAEITLGDCSPTHILSGKSIETTSINFFHQDWFEDSFGSAMVQTAIERLEDKWKV